MGKKGLDVFRAELARMVPVTEIDESAYPIDICGLRPDAITLQANLVADSVQE
jgi:hypothetical protein